MTPACLPTHVVDLVTYLISGRNPRDEGFFLLVSPFSGASRKARLRSRGSPGPPERGRAPRPKWRRSIRKRGYANAWKRRLHSACG